MDIVPAILTDNPSLVKQMINDCEEVVERVQVDIIDSVFADNKTVDPSAASYVETNLMLDFHLMVKEPLSWVQKCVLAGADRVIGHIEMMSDQMEFLHTLHEASVRAGLGVDLETPLSAIKEEAFLECDVILVMSVKAGFGGQEFDKKVIEKIKELDQMRKEMGCGYRIIVDGGVNEENIQLLLEAKADEICMGRRLWNGDLGDNVSKMRMLISNTI